MKKSKPTLPADRGGFLDSWDVDRIPVEAPLVMEVWLRMLRPRHPWCAMPNDDASGAMRAVVSELLNEAREPDDGRRDARLASALRDHAGFRRDQGLSDQLIGDELVALKLAIRVALGARVASPALAVDFATVLDAELDAKSAGSGLCY